jgi:protein gp37
MLTKRPARMAAWSREAPLPDNVWCGTSVESMAVLDRVADLRPGQGGDPPHAGL